MVIGAEMIDKIFFFKEKSGVWACKSGFFCTFAVALFGNVSEKAV